MVLWYGTFNATLVSLSLTNTPHCSVTLWYSHTSPSRLCHGTPVSYSGMTHSGIYTTPYSHLAVYVSTDIPKSTLFGPIARTLWYHHINTSRLCLNGTLAWLSLTNTPLLCDFYVVYNVRITDIFCPSVYHIFP